MMSRRQCLVTFAGGLLSSSLVLVGSGLLADEPKKADAKSESKKAAKVPADVVGVIGEVKVIAGSPSSLMVEHGSRGKNGKQPAKYQDFQIEDTTKIEFEGFKKDPQPTLAVDQKVEITFKKDSKTVIAKLVVHPKDWKPTEASKAAAAPKKPNKKPAPPKDEKKK